MGNGNSHMPHFICSITLVIFFKYTSLLAAWPRGQTPALWSLGTVFESPRGRRKNSSPARTGPIGNIESLSPIGGWG